MTKENTKILRLDSKNRICLGSLPIKGVSGYRPQINIETGQIILEPYMEVPLKEAWLYDNSDALEAVKSGITESAQGKTISLGSFKEHL